MHYDVRFDFTIRVPRDAALRLCTINGGDVIVNGTRGDFDVDNVNGLIEMNQRGRVGQRAHRQRPGDGHLHRQPEAAVVVQDA